MNHWPHCHPQLIMTIVTPFWTTLKLIMLRKTGKIMEDTMMCMVGYCHNMANTESREVSKNSPLSVKTPANTKKPNLHKQSLHAPKFSSNLLTQKRFSSIMPCQFPVPVVGKNCSLVCKLHQCLNNSKNSTPWGCSTIWWYATCHSYWVNLCLCVFCLFYLR